MGGGNALITTGAVTQPQKLLAAAVHRAHLTIKINMAIKIISEHKKRDGPGRAHLGFARRGL